jgi:hypothetical protein
LFRRNLQKAHIERLEMLLSDKTLENTDIPSIVRGELEAIKAQLSIAKNSNLNKITKYHYVDCFEKIKQLLDPK